MSKLFSQLSKEEATEIARRIVKSSNSEDEIRRRLTEAGFQGDSAVICSRRYESLFGAMVMVGGSRGEIISV